MDQRGVFLLLLLSSGIWQAQSGPNLPEWRSKEALRQTDQLQQEMHWLQRDFERRMSDHRQEMRYLVITCIVITFVGLAIYMITVGYFMGAHDTGQNIRRRLQRLRSATTIV